MKEFDFVKRKGTEINLRIGDRVLTPATFPLPMNSQKVYFIRYASKLVIGEINAIPMKPLVIEEVLPGINRYGNISLQVDADHRVKEYRIETGYDTTGLKFETGIPNLHAVPPDKKVEGRWQFEVSSIVLFGGTFNLHRAKDTVTVELDVTQPWKPGKLPFSFRVVTLFIRSFRTWPTTYRWTGTFDLKSNTILRETWKRK